MSANLADYKLFSPIELAPEFALTNRIVFGPCTRARSDIQTRVPTVENAKYYAQRASAGLIVSEGCAVSEQAYGWYGSPALYTDAQQEGWRKVVEAVHAEGGKMFLQLWHTGRQSHPSFHSNNEVVSCSSSCFAEGRTHDAQGNPTGFATTRVMTLDEVKQVVEDYRKCAERAKAAGFDGVELHGAGGYLIDEFLQSSTNKRTDQYGGSVENRFRFLRELIAAITTVYPANRVGVRLAPNGMFGGMGSDDNYEMFSYAISELSTMGLCYLATHDGFGFGRSDKSRVFTLFELKTLFKGYVMATCSYTRDQAEGVLHAGVADLVGFSRAFLVNPDLPARFRNDWPLAEPLAYEFYWDAKKGLEGYNSFPAYEG
ncbi:12-oxophytodienoate reductase [Phytophthora palmivora]|uniref:12-oxophytodienoate reductase n=1 Tax=Phytophthora palmivora TaxID=4796 RepID=A0A2P4X7T5_9STRA|nr:12-oxophytodienoate reductase [Phytophthora palmivora]